MTEPVPSRSDLAQRYAAPAPWHGTALRGAVAFVAAVFVGWVAWIAYVNATPSVESTLLGFEVDSDSSAVAKVVVQLEDDVVASCRVTAFAADRTTVGEVAFTPVPGRNDVAVRTDRRATSIELIGCTAPDQQRPR